MSSSDHETLVGAHWHNDGTAGLEVTCSCGVILLEGCDATLIPLSEIKAITEDHRDG